MADALIRLQVLLPLVARQATLPADWQAVHRAILHCFARHMRPPRLEELREWFPALDMAAVLARLVEEDLVVCDAGRATIRGAYPFSAEATGHRVAFGGRCVHAMCAVDALAVAPMCGLDTEIYSDCAHSGQPVRVRQAGETVLEVVPQGLQVGIAWQGTGGCAAHSLCRDMVFLANEAVAQDWQAGRASHEVLSLEAAHALASAFFRPLLAAS